MAYLKPIKNSFLIVLAIVVLGVSTAYAAGIPITVPSAPGANVMLTSDAGGHYVWTTSPVVNNITATTTVVSVLPNASTTQLTLGGPLYDILNSQGTGGFVLMSRGAGLGSQWVSTSTINNGVVSNSCSTGITCSGTNPSLFSISNGAITNAMLNSSSLTVTAGTGLSGGGAVSLGGSVTVSLSTPVSIANGGSNNTAAIGASSTAVISDGSKYVYQKLAPADFTTANISQWTNDSGYTTNTGTVTSVTLATPSATLSLGGTNPVTTFGTINADLNLAHSNTWSVLQTFGNASTTGLSVSTDLFIPAASTPVLAANSAGQVAVNSSTASSSLRYQDGTATRSLFPTGFGGLPFASSTLAYIGSYSSTGTTTILIANPPRPITLTRWFCKTDTGTAWVEFGTGTATTTAQCTSSGVEVRPASNNTWVQYQNVLIAIGRQGSNPNVITVSPEIRQDSD